jgi:hypothetical protein
LRRQVIDKEVKAKMCGMMQGWSASWACRARICLGTALAAFLMLVGTACSAGGQGYPTMGPATGRPISRGLNDAMNSNPLDDEKVLKALNADRQKSIVSDTNKLVKLINALDAEIARSKQDSLTEDQKRKIAEIEKLAHNVKEKMSTSVRGTPPFRPPDVHMR